jgi:ABC-type multidrug transport system fused ATPase/permease subunit
MKIPAQHYVLNLIRDNGALAWRYGATSLGRAALEMCKILLIREFLAGALDLGGAPLAAGFAKLMGPQAAVVGVALLLLLTYVGASLLSWDNNVVRQRLVKVIDAGVMDRLVRHLLTLSVAFFERLRPGDFLQAVRQDVRQLRGIFVAYAVMFVEIAVAIGMATTAIWISPELAFWALLVLPLAVFPLFRIAQKTRARSFEVRRASHVVFDVILQILRGIRIIKVFQGEEQEARNTSAKAQRYLEAEVRSVRVREFSTVVLESLAGLSIALVVILGGFRIASGQLGWPEFFAFVLAVRALNGPIDRINNEFIQVQRFAAAAQRLTELFETQPDVRDAPETLPLQQPISQIELENVCFSYGEAPAVDHLSLQLRSGETLGIAGPSGSGKTTLLGLVARFYDPTEGSVRVNGVDLRKLRVDDLYRQLAIVTQEPFLFEATVRENIRCGRPAANNAEVERAAQLAELHEEILALPDGYDTLLGAGGRGVSGGQAQRINVARAVLKDAPVLLLDEATSNLDSIAEAKVQRAIDRLMEGRTTLIVAHRLSALRHADRILVMDQGRRVGLDGHEALLQSCPLYRQMWETQQVKAAPSEPQV